MRVGFANWANVGNTTLLAAHLRMLSAKAPSSTTVSAKPSWLARASESCEEVNVEVTLYIVSRNDPLATTLIAISRRSPMAEAQHLGCCQ